MANATSGSNGSQANKQKTRKPGPKQGSANNSNNRSSSNGQSAGRKAAARSRGQNWSIPEVPSWVGIAASVVGAGLAAGYFAWRNQQSGRSWGDNFNAAFADGETDEENFDQTRNSGQSGMKSDLDDWEEIDDMSDASFPASDPPSFNPGTA